MFSKMGPLFLDPYEALGVSSDATQVQIEAAYHKNFWTDPWEEAFRLIRDKNQRQYYDDEVKLAETIRSAGMPGFPSRSANNLKDLRVDKGHQRSSNTCSMHALDVVGRLYLLNPRNTSVSEELGFSDRCIPPDGLPTGVEHRWTSDGRTYSADHNNKTITWPLPPDAETKKSALHSTGLHLSRLEDPQAPENIEPLFSFDYRVFSDHTYDMKAAWTKGYNSRSANHTSKLQGGTSMSQFDFSLLVPRPRIKRPQGSYPTIPGLLNGKKEAPLADFGASHNCMSEKYARRNGFEINGQASDPIKMANGRLSAVVGTVTLSFSFTSDSVAHPIPFKVLRNCVQDLILGGPFLRMTETFTRFTKRIVWKLGNMFHRRVSYLGHEASQQYIQGWLDGEHTYAIPDTGSEVMLVSEVYALSRGWSVSCRPEHCIKLQLGDGSITRTNGIVRDVEWKFERNGETYRCDFHVLKDLPCNVILSCDFVCDTNTFQEYPNLLLDLHDTGSGWSEAGLNVVVNISARVQRLKTIMRNAMKGGAQSTDAQAKSGVLNTSSRSFEKESETLVRRIDAIKRLPEKQRALESLALEAEWDQLLAKYYLLPYGEKPGNPA